ncbi:redoxin domain-containing protein [Bradyrhizobium sp. Arg314]
MTHFALAYLAGTLAVATVAAKLSMRQGYGLRHALGVALVVGTATIWLGLSSDILTPWHWGIADILEDDLTVTMLNEPNFGIGFGAHAAPYPTLSGPVGALVGAQQWLNTKPLRSEHLRGKVVVVNFWTYTCVYSLRALPYIRAWARKYADNGLVVVGVHSPEFSFEKELPNVRRESAALGVGYPVAIDNDFGIWRAFNNNAWPALYIIGTDGRVRRHVIGEGGYDQSEKLIQQLLSEANGVEISGDIAVVPGEGPQKAADKPNLRSFETYVGYGLGRTFASPGGVKKDVPSLYKAPGPLPLNRWGLVGRWTIGREFATLNDNSGKIAFRFHARDLHLILAPQSQDHPIRFRVTVDGAPPGPDHGFDVDTQGWGTLKDARMYQLVRQAGPVVDRTFEIEFLDAGARAYDFTFG